MLFWLQVGKRVFSSFTPAAIELWLFTQYVCLSNSHSGSEKFQLNTTCMFPNRREGSNTKRTVRSSIEPGHPSSNGVEVLLTAEKIRIILASCLANKSLTQR